MKISLLLASSLLILTAGCATTVTEPEHNHATAPVSGEISG